MPEYGDRISVLGAAHLIEGPRNPGQFDYAEYMRRRGVFFEVRAKFPTDCTIVSHGNGYLLQAVAFRCRHWIQQRLAADLEDSPELVSTVQSIVLGMQRDTPEDLKALLQRTGTVHLVAVSGLNVVILALLLRFLLTPLRLGRIITPLIILAALWFYAVVTGLGTACVRSTTMFSIFLIAALCDRKSLSYNNLGAAALLILGFDTNQLFSAGFQFSFTVVALIIAIASPIQKRIAVVGLPDEFLPRKLWNWRQETTAWIWDGVAHTSALSISAWIGSLLFTVGYFHMFSPSALVANALAVGLAFCVLAASTGSLLMAAVWKPLALSFNNANWAFASLLVGLLKFCTSLPAGYFYVETPRLSRSPTAEIEALDLGDGGAIHLRTGGKDWLIDCGNASAYERIVLPYLRSRGVNNLNGLVFAHGSTRHLGAAISVLDDFHPRAVAESVLMDRSPAHKRVHTELAQRKIGKALYERGDAIRLTDSVALRVLYPPAGLKRGPADDKALVLQLDCDGARVLFMSDSGFSTEQWLLENEPDLRSDLIIKGRHAKDFSGTLDFLARVQPQAIVCGSLPFGKQVETLNAWENDTTQQGIVVFRQDHVGAVNVKIRDGRLEVRAFVGGQAFLSRVR